MEICVPKQFLMKLCTYLLTVGAAGLGGGGGLVGHRSPPPPKRSYSISQYLHLKVDMMISSLNIPLQPPPMRRGRSQGEVKIGSGSGEVGAHELICISFASSAWHLLSTNSLAGVWLPISWVHSSCHTDMALEAGPPEEYSLGCLCDRPFPIIFLGDPHPTSQGYLKGSLLA